MNLMNNIFIALIHYPVKRDGKVITSSITNLDLHDISRISATYGLGGYFVVHPESRQRMIASKLTEHWISGEGKDYNPDRCEAFKKLKIVSDLEEAKRQIFEKTGAYPAIFGTTARKTEKSVPISTIKITEKPALILFGTAGGIDEQLLDNIDFILEPIELGTGYNHLSVRSATAIFIDRLATNMYISALNFV